MDANATLLALFLERGAQLAEATLGGAIPVRQTAEERIRAALAPHILGFIYSEAYSNPCWSTVCCLLVNAACRTGKCPEIVGF